METKKLVDELKELSAKDPIERSFMRYADEARRIAMAGGTEMRMDIMKRNFFVDQLTQYGQLTPTDPKFDAQIDEMYEAQRTLVQKFRDEGCTVTEEKPSAIIVADITESREESMQREMERRYLETKCTISWGDENGSSILA